MSIPAVPLRCRVVAGVRLAAVFALVFSPGTARAHSFEITDADVLFTRDGTIEAAVTYHVDAMLADIPYGDMTEQDYERLRTMPEEEREERLTLIEPYLRTSVRLKFDGTAIDGVLTFPELDAAKEAGEAIPLPGHRFLIRGEVPEDALEFVFTASPVFNIVQLEIRREGEEEVYEEVLNPGALSQPYPLDSFHVTRGRFEVAVQYAVLGYQHIVPKGLDHILFVLGLYLLSTKLGPLLWQITAFTLAHTLSLALSMYGVIQLSPRIVEPLIALSIVYVAVENLFTSELKPWRPAVVAGFGLLHGLGFAGVLSQLGMPANRFVSALVSFNLGVEAGQLTVIAIAFAVVGWCRTRTWYRARVVVPASCAVALIALYWTVERLLG